MTDERVAASPIFLGIAAGPELHAPMLNRYIGDENRRSHLECFARANLDHLEYVGHILLAQSASPVEGPL